MKLRCVFFLFLFIFVFSGLYAQSMSSDDSEVAEQYVLWVQQAIKENRMREALAAIERAADFSNVSSDISYLLAFVRSRERKNRNTVLEALEQAIEINRWFFYSEYQALLLKAEQLIAMRDYNKALLILNQYIDADADAAMLYLLALRGLTANPPDPVLASAYFRSRTLEAMDRYPRDPRPLRIFFDYARNGKLESSIMAEGDLNLLDLALRRLPFLLEADPELAWIAASFIHDTEEARLLVASYRAGGIPHVQIRDFRPHPGSIAAALNFGLLGDEEAVEELFSATRGFNYPLPGGIVVNDNPVLERSVITEVYTMLRSEEGRDFFTKKLLSFSGIIIDDGAGDGYLESRAICREGVIREIVFDLNGDNNNDLQIIFTADGSPLRGEYSPAGEQGFAHIQWERYPSVIQVQLANEFFNFRPADFQFTPVAFVELGGSKNRAGLAYPVPLHYNLDLTRRSLVSFCENLQRPSVEFKGAIEQIFFNKGIPLHAVVKLNEKQVSVTEFEKGRPSVQRLDMDFDGRMETIRRFNYTDNIASSESDWTGEGIYKTGEVYLPDGSVVYLWDIDGKGLMNYSETRVE